jgi:hypothetical protein
MTAGLSASRANSILNVLRNTAYSAIATPFVKLHTGDPGSAGTANAAGATTRNAITWNAASGGSMTLATLSAFTGTTSETITHISIWDASTAGNFIESWALTASVPIINGSSLTFSTFTLSFSPIAA